MRCNQVSIFIERFDKYVPKDYPCEVQRISVYVDDYESIYAALCKAYALAVDELAEHERIGVRANLRTNEFAKSDYKQMYGQLPQSRRRHEDDLNWEYYESRLELCEDYVWVFEHSAEILEIITKSKDVKETAISLKETFELSDYQVKKLLQFRFDMLTKQDYEKYKDEVTKIKEKKIGMQALPHDDESYKEYARLRIRELDSQINEMKAFLLAAEHYSEIIEIMEASDEFHHFAKTMEEKFGFNREQSRYFQYMSVRDFSRKNRDEAEQKLQWRLEEKERWEKDLK